MDHPGHNMIRHWSVVWILLSLTTLNIILRIFLSLCLTNRQSGAPHPRTPTRFLIGAVIEKHLLSGVVSKSDGLSSFGEADQRYQRIRLYMIHYMHYTLYIIHYTLYIQIIHSQSVQRSICCTRYFCYWKLVGNYYHHYIVHTIINIWAIPCSVTHTFL